MKDKIKLIIAQVLNIPVESIQDDASTKTIENWDSLNHMNIIFAIEDEFSINFADEDIMELTSIPKLLSALNKIDNK